MLTIAVTILLYYGISIVFGIVGLRRQTASKYITAPSGTDFISLTLTLVATVVGGGMFLGISQLGFQQGLPAFSLGASYFFGSIIMGVLATPIREFAKQKGVITLFGAIDVLYPPKRKISVSAVFAAVSFLVFILMLAAQFVAIGSYLAFYTSVSFSKSIIFGAAGVAIFATFVYGALGGFTRDVFTDVLQMIFIFIGVALVCYAITTNNFMGNMRQLPGELFYGQKGHLVFFVGSLLFVAPTFLVRFDLWQRIITAKSDKQARAAFFFSGVLNFIFFAVFGLIGLYARGSGLSDSPFVGLEVIERVVKHPVAKALAMAAFFAAIISTADTFLGVAGLSASRALYKRGELEAPDNRGVSVRKLRLITLVIGFASIIVAYLIRNIVDLFASAFGILLVFLPSFLGGFLRKTTTQLECYLSICAGLIVVIPLTFFFPKEAFLPGLLSSILGYWVGLGIQKRRQETKSIQ